MKRLGGWDAMLLYCETPNLHMHTLKVAIIDAADFDGDFTFALFRRTLRRHLHRLEPLRYQLVDMPLKLHRPIWLEESEIDLDYHVRRVALADPGGRRELDGLIGEIASTPLDRSRPLWEFYFVEGMSDDRFAVIAKVHHALADGVASGNLMARAMDLQGSRQHDRDLYATNPSKMELLSAVTGDHLQQIRKLPALVKDTVAGVSRVRRRSRERAEHPAIAPNFRPPETFMNHVVSPTRTFASATLALSEFKDTKNHLGVTINDLVLAISAGALRELLLRYDGCADEPIIASVPASLDRSPDRISGNELGGMFVSLPVQVADPLERVRLTHLAAEIAKENYAILGPDLVHRWIAYLPPALTPSAFRWLSRRDARNKLFNVTVSNVAGPRVPGRIAGAPVCAICSVGPLMTGSGMNITVWSYVDQINISVIADDLTLVDPHEATEAMVNAFAEIRLAAGFRPESRHRDRHDHLRDG